ncbi:MAG: type II toxin-antitoxin system VapC family toxin [Candidatus Omnitrophica bacterium]|nr:type II toxin-antitoxin system VapC family toxin [Candidatus Omnitrophota bacterium]
MKLFLDTSALVKKYVIEEYGAQRLSELLKEASVVIVSPVTWIEIHHVFYRIKKEGLLDTPGLKKVLKDVAVDYVSFHVAAFNNALEEKAVKILEEFPLRSLDAIQLAAAMTTGSGLFCTADVKLYEISKKHLKRTELIANEDEP